MQINPKCKYIDLISDKCKTAIGMKWLCNDNNGIILRLGLWRKGTYIEAFGVDGFERCSLVYNVFKEVCPSLEGINKDEA